ncbi:MAG: hypothetical protein U0822_21005 [Anaerolineae bacterium]
MNKTLLESLTDMLLGMGLTEEDVMPLADLADCLVELDLDRDGGPDASPAGQQDNSTLLLKRERE